jgi:TolB-like protein
VKRNGTVVAVSTAAVAALLIMVGYTVHREAVSRATKAANEVTVSAKAAIAPAASNPDAAVAVAPPNSVAVLPFVDLSEKKDQEYFSDGLSEELIDLLAKNPDLRVPARTSSFYFKGKQATIAEIAKTLGVAHVLEGSVRRAGKTIRVTVQLIRADNGYHLWSETYDRELKDIFKVQDEIAAAVVKSMQAKLLSGRPQLSARRTDNSEAYDQYLIGKQAYSRDDYQLAVSAYKRSVALDPNFAAAYAGLAEAEADLEDSGTGERAALRRALAAAERAIALAPDQPEGYAVRGELRFTYFWDWKGGRADIEKAMAYDPANSAVQLRYGELLAGLGLLPQAIAAVRKTIDADPLSGVAWKELGNWLMNNRQFAAAREALNRAIQISPEPWPSFKLAETELLDGRAEKDMAPTPIPWARFYLAETELLDGHAEKAMALTPMLRGDGRLFIKALAACVLGPSVESRQALDELVARYAPTSAYSIAQVYACRGETDKTFEWLDRSYAQRDSGLMWIKTDPLLDNIRSDARFAAMLKKMNLPE